MQMFHEVLISPIYLVFLKQKAAGFGEKIISLAKPSAPYNPFGTNPRYCLQFLTQTMK